MLERIAVVIAIAALVLAALFMVLLGPVAIGVGIYEANTGKTLDAVVFIVGGVAAGAFAWRLTPGMLRAYFGE